MITETTIKDNRALSSCLNDSGSQLTKRSKFVPASNYAGLLGGCIAIQKPKTVIGREDMTSETLSARRSLLSSNAHQIDRLSVVLANTKQSVKAEGPPIPQQKKLKSKNIEEL